ncbi:MAG: NADH-quinone oxidoreductase subunit A [Alphaproteobacteria bacterium]|jgi:NADH-quinone oxidoreductase subunit A|nr:NADH-quinone oxidoreductase subunit A [Alphaproteobacteria bacterium]
MEVANISTAYMFEYFPVLFFIIIALGIMVAALLASYFIVPQNPYPNKISAYECGFDAIEDTSKQFDVRFYLVAVLFIIFDIEIIFMYPWAVSFSSLSDIGFYSMLLFLFMLGVGFIYEWKKGALQWD